MRKVQIFLSRWRVRLGHIFALVLLFFAKPDAVSLIAGSVLAVIGEMFRVFAAGYIDKDEILSRAGPYAWTRNPLYFGSFVLYLGFCIAGRNPYIIALYFPFFFVVYFSTILLEEKFLTEKFGDEFKSYTASVPRFFPRLNLRTSAPPHLGTSAPPQFYWEKVMKNREYEGVLGLIIVLILLILEFCFRFSPYRLIF